MIYLEWSERCNDVYRDWSSIGTATLLHRCLSFFFSSFYIRLELLTLCTILFIICCRTIEIYINHWHYGYPFVESLLTRYAIVTIWIERHSSYHLYRQCWHRISSWLSNTTWHGRSYSRVTRDDLISLWSEEDIEYTSEYANPSEGQQWIQNLFHILESYASDNANSHQIPAMYMHTYFLDTNYSHWLHNSDTTTYL